MTMKQTKQPMPAVTSKNNLLSRPPPDAGLRLSEFTNLKKENIRWQERRLVLYGNF